MGLPKLKPRYTVDQYLAIERASQERHIFLDGEIYAMAGESLAHGAISVRLVSLLDAQLIDTPCQVLSKDTVRSGPIPSSGAATTGMFSYPDVLVVCDEPQFHDAFKDIILNPKAILEVLSPSTEAFDRGDKFERFQEWNPSLSDYLLVSQDQPRIVHYRRDKEGAWTYQLHSGLEAVVRIESINCTLPLGEVYKRVRFDAT